MIFTRTWFWHLVALCAFSSAWATLDTVTIQLSGPHQFRFAGYYAAQSKGFYESAGLCVRIQPGDASQGTVSQVLSQKAQFGVATSQLMLNRSHGQPVVVLATIFQHSPEALFARLDSSLTNIHDLAGRRVMMGADSSELIAYLLREKIDPANLQLTPFHEGIQDLQTGKVDALSGQSTSIPYQLHTLAIPFITFYPRTAGVDFYGDNLFTSEHEIQQYPDRVEAFRKASLLGWEYAMGHQGEIIHLLRTNYQSPLDSLQLAYEATSMQNLVANPLVPIGYSYRGRWEHISSVFQDVGLMPGPIDLTGFLYQTNQETSADQTSNVPRKIWGFALAAGLLLLFTGLYNIRLRHQLSKLSVVEKAHVQAREDSEKSRQQLIETLRELELWATTDKLTELANRRQLEQRAETEVARAHRYNTALSLILIDLDHFKQVNDKEGHPMGDAVLVEVAKLLRRMVRTSDLPGRWGGEEFMVLVPGTNEEQALILAEKLRKAFENHQYPSSQKITASFGVSLCKEGDTLETLLRKADEALYEAKRQGRNRVIAAG